MLKIPASKSGLLNSWIRKFDTGTESFTTDGEVIFCQVTHRLGKLLKTDLDVST